MAIITILDTTQQPLTSPEASKAPIKDPFDFIESKLYRLEVYVLNPLGKIPGIQTVSGALRTGIGLTQFTLGLISAPFFKRGREHVIHGTENFFRGILEMIPLVSTSLLTGRNVYCEADAKPLHVVRSAYPYEREAIQYDNSIALDSSKNPNTGIVEDSDTALLHNPETDRFLKSYLGPKCEAIGTLFNWDPETFFM